MKNEIAVLLKYCYENVLVVVNNVVRENEDIKKLNKFHLTARTAANKHFSNPPGLASKIGQEDECLEKL